MNNIEIDQYKKFHKKRTMEKYAKQEKKRQSIIAAFPDIAKIFKQLNAKRVIIYGSALSPGQFYPQSDLDILVFGLDDNQWVEAFRNVESIESIKHTSIDIKFDSIVDNSFIDYILTHCDYMDIL
jgi:predicted nucleotidyltransferase